jgi:hypothetical protein
MVNGVERIGEQSDTLDFSVWALTELPFER